MSVKVTVGQQTFIKKIVLGTPITTARETLSIDEFTDFDVSTKSDAQILVFDSSEGVFKNFTFDVGQGLAREYSPADDKLIIGIDSDKTPVVTGILSKGNLTPTLDSAFDLGDSARKWRNLHLSGKTIFLGGLKVKDSGGDFAVKDSNEQPVNFDLSGSISQIRGYFSSGGDLSYDSSTGRFEFDVEQVYTKANFDSDLGAALSGGVGIAYDSATDTISIDSAELEANFKQDIRGYFSSSNSLNYNSTTGDFRLPQPLDSAANPTFANITATGDVTFDSSGAILFDKSDKALEFGDNYKAVFGDNDDLQIYHHNNGTGIIQNAGAGQLQLRANTIRLLNQATDENFAFFNDDGSVDLYHNNIKRFETTDSGIAVTDHISLADNGEARFGTGDDLQIYHTGTTGNIKNTTGSLILQAPTVRIQDAGSSQTAISASNGIATLLFENSAKLATTDSGVTVTGSIRGDSATVPLITADSALITNISGSSANFTALHSKSTTLDSAHIDALTGDSARFNDLHADSAHITNLTASTISFNDIDVDSADITNLTGDSADITNVSGSSLNFANIHSSVATLDSATLTNVTADSGVITDISGTNLNYIEIHSKTALLDSATLTNVTADSAVITDISGTSANYVTVHGSTATFDSAIVTDISGNTLNFGTLNGIYEGFDSDLARTTSRQTIRTYLNAVDAGGDGSFAYDSALGKFTYTGPSSTEVRAHLSASNSLSYNSTTGDFRLPQPLDSAANPTFNQLRGPASFIIDPAAIGDNTGTVRILGNLQVEGTQTIINSTTVSLNDKNIVIADSAADSSALDGGGITWGGASIVDTPSFNYSHADARLVSNREINAPLFSGSGAALTNLPAASLTGTIDSARIPTLLIADIGNITSIDHDALTNFVANEHIDHTSVSITAGTGLKGGGTIAATRDLAIDSSELYSLYKHDDFNDFVADEHVAHSGVSITAGFGLKGGGTIASTRDLAIDSAELLTYYEPIIRHDNLSGFVANEHIDHTTVSITAGSGLKGGGTIASTRDLAIDSSELTTHYRPLIRSYLNVVDAGGDGSFAYDSALGKFTYTGPSASEVRAHLNGGHGIVYSTSTGNISVDSSEVRGLFSAAGDLTYNSGTGEFSFDVEQVYTKNNFDSDYFFAKDSANTAVERGKHTDTVKEFTVVVASKNDDHVYNGNGSSLGYKVDGTFSPVIHLQLGRTYRFNQEDNSNSNHPIAFYYAADKTGGTFTTGVTNGSGSAGSSNAYTQIVVSEATPPVLHYQCTNHGFMGHAVVIGTRNLTGFTTSNLTEGSNLYFLNSRARSAISLGSAGSRAYNSSTGQITIPGTTDHITEGSNLFFTDARAQAVSLDSAEAIQLIDSAYVQARQLPSTDSAATQAMIDSNLNNNITFGGDVIFDSSGALFFDKSNKSLKFGDNYRAFFGASTDLQIFHDGNNSVIRDAGQGDLFIRGSVVRLDDPTSKDYLVGNAGGSVELYYNGTKKFETTDSGVNVTGEISADSAKFDRLTSGGLLFPTSDGLNNQVIKTDGNGNLSFVSVTAISGNIDSAAVIQLVDSNYINTRVDFDSASVTQLIDSSYVQIRVPETYLATLIDSAYVQARTTAGTDSAATISLIQNTVDSAYVALREANVGGGGTTGFINNVGTSSFVGDSSTKSFTLAQTPADSDDAFVFINGLLQHTNTYAISGQTLTLDSAPVTGDEIEVRTHLLQSASLTLRDHKSYIYTLGTNTTTLSGNDSSGTSLTYDVGKVDVFVNGARLVDGKDFTATTGTSIVFDSAFSAGNIVEVVSHAKATTTDLNGILSIDSDLTTTSANQIIYTYAAANHRTLKFTAQLEHDASSSYHAEEVLLTHNGTNVAMTTYAQVLLDSNLGTFDADINSGNVRIKFTPTKTNTSIKLRAIRTPA